MPKPSESEKALLEGRHYAILATHNEDGSIHLTPVWYVFQDGQFFIGTGSASRKARNVRARPSASVIVDVRKPGAERWVSLSGPADLLSGEQSTRINAKILSRYLTEDALNDPRVGPAFAAADDVTIRIQPVKCRSWNSSDLDRQFFGGLLSSAPGKWFLPAE